MMLYLGIYLVFGAVYCLVTRSYLYDEMSKSFPPLLILIVLTVFWLPFIFYGMFIDVRQKVQEIRLFTIGDLRRSLDKDNRFSFKDGVYIQEEKHCLSCRTTSNLEVDEIDVSDTEEEDGDDEDEVYYGIDCYICSTCKEKDVNILEVLEKEKKYIKFFYRLSKNHK